MNTQTLPAFSKINPETIESELDLLLAENRARIASILTLSEPYTWENLVHPLEILENNLHQFWTPITHLHAVAQTKALRKAYKKCLTKIVSYHTEIAQNENLYRAFLSLSESKDFKNLHIAQQKIIQNNLRDFRLSGIALPPKEKKRFAQIQKSLSKLSNKFEENVLDATQAWKKHITNKDELAGIPEHVIATAHETAKKNKLSGWLLTLEFPCYFPVLSYADNRSLREEIYKAYVTRASDQTIEKKFDNAPIIEEILKLRHELSELLGKKNYAELSLATKMAKSPETVLDFVNDVLLAARTKAEKELEELKTFAQENNFQGELKPWDISYYSEKLRKKLFGINDEILRPYFQEEKVLQGMFYLVHKLYGTKITEKKNIDVWHKSVRFFEIHDEQNKLRGQFYIDLYAREKKREGAWMDHQSNRFLVNGELQTPIVYLTCNLTPPSDEKPSLLTHDEVVTIFHEFGHGLHHMLTKIDYPEASGTNGVEWDAVELPSQFMEFFTWEKPVLEFISEHIDTKEALPETLIFPLLAAKCYHSGMRLLRQLEFTLFDFQLHLEYNPEKNAEQIQAISNKVREKVSIVKAMPYNRFQNTFGHVFSGSYAAGYYSYLWAEMLASDAFSKFEENGIFDEETGKSFLQNILEKGGSQDALDLFTAFRGRAPTVDAMLKHYGIERNG
jgi:oligopeptidase A